MHEKEIDINDVAAKFLTSKTDDIANIAKSTFRKINNSIKVKLKKNYTNYLKALADRYGKTRTFFLKDSPKPLYEFYVPVSLAADSTVIKFANVIELVGINQRAIIQGSAGSGKTIVLKHLLLDSLVSHHKVPVFLELRKLDNKETGIRSFIYSSLNTFGLNIDEDYFEKSLAAGHYIILLDGLDEVPIDWRGVVIKEVENFSKKYPNCDYIITTRPDEMLLELRTFTVFKTLPLDLERSISLIKKLPAEEAVKEKFIVDLRSELFERHKTFLSNPLLLSIMLLTYGSNADIPNRISIFYNQAFETLFLRHDAHKGAYKRIRETDLDIVSFEKAFCAFSILAYDSNSIIFSKMAALHFIEKAKQITDKEFNSEAFLTDLLIAVCLLMEDGLFLTYTHRSFQEYFAARFIANSSEIVKKTLIKKYLLSKPSDGTIKLYYELDQEFMEKEIILPELESLFQEIGVKNRIGKTHYLRFLKRFFSEICMMENYGITVLIDVEDQYKFSLWRLVDEDNEDYFPAEYKYSKEDIPEDADALNTIDINTQSLTATNKHFITAFDSKGWMSPLLLLRLKYRMNALAEKYKKLDKNLEALLKAQ